MILYRLAASDLQLIVFRANDSELKYRLHSACIEFTQTYNLSRAILYVHHHSQGWHQVFDCNNYYVIINNPLKLNYEKLAIAVHYTLAQCNSWPTDKERYKMREQRLAEERVVDAEIRRRSFRILQGDRDKS